MKLLRILAVLVVLVAMGGGAAYLMREDIVNWWLQRQLAAELSKISGAEVETGDVRYRNGVLSAGLCRVSGANMPFASLEIRDARVPIDWERIKNPAGEPLRLEAASVDLIWRDANASGPQRGPLINAEKSGITMPVVEMAVERFSYRHEDSAGWRIADSNVRGKYDAGEWSFSGRGGMLHAPGWPPLGIDSLAGEHRAAETIIERFALNGPKGGFVEGSAKGVEGKWSGDFRWKDVAMELVLPEGATKHFTARSSGSGRLSDATFRGHMELAGAEARNLPALVKLASIFTGENYDNVAWETARFDFIRDARGAVLIENLTAISSKGLSLQGSGAFAHDHLSADLQLGLKREGRPWLVAFMPILFRSEKDGYLWTPVKVGGTPQAPTEDLTKRVVAALAVAPATQAVETAVEVPATAVEAAGNLLRGLLGR
jgi:hypothetical protein